MIQQMLYKCGSTKHTVNLLVLDTALNSLLWLDLFRHSHIHTDKDYRDIILFSPFYMKDKLPEFANVRAYIQTAVVWPKCSALVRILLQ